ncbi:hypothetical protein ABZX51_007114 [Aspergillus tubingensis]
MAVNQVLTCQSLSLGEEIRSLSPMGAAPDFVLEERPLKTGALADHRPGVAIIILITMHIVAIEAPGQPGDKARKAQTRHVVDAEPGTLSLQSSPKGQSDCSMTAVINPANAGYQGR